MTHSFDEKIMNQALKLAMKGRITAPPNPWVGCIIVKNNAIIGEGFHHAAGEPHAEILALQQAGEAAKGATVYVTLEPCAHFGRTPPCVNALVKAEVSRVVVGIEDPDRQVKGSGIAQLKAAGISVSLGVNSREIMEAMSPYLYHRKTGLPFCLGKAAISIDGRIAAQDLTSQWITCEAARHDAMQLRAESQAIMVGTRTALLDKPRLTVRDLVEGPSPLRVVLDLSGKLIPPNPLLDISLAPTLILTAKNCPKRVRLIWEKAGVEVMEIGVFQEGKAQLREVLEILGKKNIIQLLIEGGGSLLQGFLEEKFLQQLTLYIGPRILGINGIPLFNNFDVLTLKESPELIFLGSKPCGQTIRLDYSLSSLLHLS